MSKWTICSCGHIAEDHNNYNSNCDHCKCTSYNGHELEPEKPPAHVVWLGEMLDISNPQYEVEIQVDHSQPDKVIRVNVDDVCRLRICRIPSGALRIVHMNPYQERQNEQPNIPNRVPEEGTGILDRGVEAPVKGGTGGNEVGSED